MDTSIPPEDTSTPPPDPGDPTTEPTTDTPGDPTTTDTTTTEDTTTIPEDTTTTEETTTSEPTTTIPEPSTTTEETTTSEETTTPPPTTTSESTSSVVTTNPGGGTTTLETVITVGGPSSPSTTPSQTSDSANSDDRGFFGNTGAVAGVFSVVGVLVLILAVVLVTTCIRRRRRKQFDRDVDEAAREAAGAQPPIFLDDADDNNFRNKPAFTGYSDRSNAYTGYSDTTHGTYAQPPMMDQYNGESYGMQNVSSQQPYDTGFAGVGAGAGAAGAGIAGLGTRRARSQRRPDDNSTAGFGSSGHHQGFGEDLSPYPAFVAPGAGNHTNAYASDSRYPSNATDPYPAFIAPPPEAGSRRSQHAASGNFNDASTTAAASSQPSYAERYQPGYKGGDQLPPPSHAPAPVANSTRAASVYDDDAYGGYSSHGHGSANDHRDGYGNSPSPRDSDNDDDMPRVLQVANR